MEAGLAFFEMPFNWKLVLTIFAACFFALPATLYWFWRYKELRRLGWMQCPLCGVTFGVEAARQARANYEKVKQEVQRQSPLDFVDFDGIWPVQCSHCEQPSSFDSFQGKLLATQPK